jgi:hypothetical protein
LMKSEKCTGKVDESMSISTVEMIWKWNPTAKQQGHKAAVASSQRYLPSNR